MKAVAWLLSLSAACAPHAHKPEQPPLAPPENGILGADVELPQRRTTGPLTPAERDSLIRTVAAHRAAWHARHISAYRIRLAIGCFCPWPGNPAILEVRDGVAVGLRDTTGKSIGKPREPWSLYTVDGLFDAVEQSAQGADVVEVGFDPTYDYPALIRGDGKVGLPDDWFWVRASRLTPLR